MASLGAADARISGTRVSSPADPTQSLKVVKRQTLAIHLAIQTANAFGAWR